MTFDKEILQHDATVDGVYLVAMFDKEKFIKHAVFSTFAKAKKWIDDGDTKFTYMCAPFVLDRPDAGVQ